MSDVHGVPQRPDVGRVAVSAPGGKKKRSRGKRTLLWTLGVLSVLVVGFVVLVAVGIHKDVEQDNLAQPGQCVNLSGADSSLGMKVVDCAAPAASYLVAARSPSKTGTCPSGDYLKYIQTARIGGDFTLCLAYNWKQGDCFTDNVSADNGAQRIDCAQGAGPNRFQVTQVLTGTADKTKCVNQGYYAVYTQPAEVFCYKNL